MKEKKILIIKFGGLGDIILSLNAIYSIRNEFKDHKLILLTEMPYKDFLEKSKWFDDIIVIKRSFFYFNDILQIRKKLNVLSIEKVFDLQTSNRSSFYLKIFYKQNIYTNGIGKFAKAKHDNPNRDEMHTMDRQREQLKLSNVIFKKKINLNWLYPSTKKDNEKIALIVPGGSKKRLYKRIPIEIFATIIKFLITKKIKPILIGSEDDFLVCEKLFKIFPTIKNYCNKTDLLKIAQMSKQATISLGNDTGPMHIIARGDNPTLVFFTEHSNYKLCGQQGKKVSIMRFEKNNLEFSDQVLEKIKKVTLT